MIDRKREDANIAGAAKRHLEESVASGRITRSEADVIKQFFSAVPLPDWPSSGLQRRMQFSGGGEPTRAADRKSDTSPE